MTRDKKIVLGIVFGFTLFSVSSWFPNPELKDLVRTALGVALSVCLYLGYSWSRWVMGVLSALAVLVGVLSLVSSSVSVEQIVIIGLMLGFYGYAAFYLLNPNLLKSHFKGERA
ncbi:hypothetical protein [Microbulbifer aggregans]|uniref:hypothetical protein n=1 Tax=Microbulbifer aggregans TaxID=1769779 RepID=UPI0011AB7592|nr:hypothetical protein [Microbulbifer aggregans]